MLNPLKRDWTNECKILNSLYDYHSLGRIDNIHVVDYDTYVTIPPIAAGGKPYSIPADFREGNTICRIQEKSGRMMKTFHVQWLKKQ